MYFPWLCLLGKLNSLISSDPCLFILFDLLTGTLPINFHLSLMFFYSTLPLHVRSALLFSAGRFAFSRTSCEVGWSCGLGNPAVYFGGILDCHWVPPVCLGRFVIFCMVRIESPPTSTTILSPLQVSEFTQSKTSFRLFLVKLTRSHIFTVLFTYLFWVFLVLFCKYLPGCDTQNEAMARWYKAPPYKTG